MAKKFKGIPGVIQKETTTGELRINLGSEGVFYLIPATDKLDKSGGDMTGDINFKEANAGKGISWYKNSDWGKIYFESTLDTTGDSNLVFENGDNVSSFGGPTEGFLFIKINTELGPEPIKEELLKINPTQFRYKGLNIAFFISLTYAASDINSDGNLVIKAADIPKLVGKKLVSAYVGDEPVPGANFYRSANYISNFGGFAGASQPIELTFI